jgi:riboflavin biosynthesis pyrimidine reductase
LLGSGTVEFRQLLPETATIALDDLLAQVGPSAPAPDDRPYVIVNFVSSADGRATFQGRSGALGDDGDHALFHGLREHADAVMAGTSTLRIERYGRILSRPERRERRLVAGRSAEPLACVVTRTGQLPTDIPLFAEPEARVLVFAAVEVELEGTAAQVELIPMEPGEMTLTTVLRRLRADHGVGLLLCEGGPTLYSSLLHERLVDELFLTLSPKLTGGGLGPAITNGPELPEPAELMTIWLLERSGSVYLRYGLQEWSR